MRDERRELGNTTTRKILTNKIEVARETAQADLSTGLNTRVQTYRLPPPFSTTAIRSVGAGGGSRPNQGIGAVLNFLPDEIVVAQR